MKRVKIAVAGAGLIAQVEHIPNLLFLRDRFDLVAVADPSPQGRAMLESRHGVRARASFDELLELSPDAVLIAAPDAYHADFAGRALAREHLENNLYSGPAPVPIAQYAERVRQQKPRDGWLTKEALAKAFRGMVLTERVLAQIGPAVAAGGSMLLYGKPGTARRS